MVKHTIHAVFPDASVILFGSRARDDEKPDSDWDLLIVVDKEKITPSDYDCIFNPLYDLGLQIDEFFSIKVYSKKQWIKRNFTPFYKNIEKEGVLL